MNNKRKPTIFEMIEENRKKFDYLEIAPNERKRRLENLQKRLDNMMDVPSSCQKKIKEGLHINSDCDSSFRDIAKSYVEKLNAKIKSLEALGYLKNGRIVNRNATRGNQLLLTFRTDTKEVQQQIKRRDSFKTIGFDKESFVSRYRQISQSDFSLSEILKWRSKDIEIQQSWLQNINNKNDVDTVIIQDVQETDDAKNVAIFSEFLETFGITIPFENKE